MVTLFCIHRSRLRAVRLQVLAELRSLRSLRPLPQSTSSSLCDNSYLAGPSPCPCPGVDTSARACSLPGFYALKLGPYNPNDNLLLPPCLGDYLPQNHPSRVVSTIIDRLDISEIEAVANKFSFVWKGRTRRQTLMGHERASLNSLCDNTLYNSTCAKWNRYYRLNYCVSTR